MLKTCLLFLSLGFTFQAHACDILINDDVPKDIRAEILDTLTFLDSIQGNGASSLHKEIFGGDVSGKTYCKFIQDRVLNFQYSNFPGDKDVSAQNIGGSLLIGNVFRKFNIVDRANSLLHEARHSEWGGWIHVTCPDSFSKDETLSYLAGRMGCEDSVYGAYSIEIIFSRNLQKYCTSCSSEEKAQAAAREKIIFQRVINEKAKAELLAD